jgi:hypothetical protein
MGRTSTHDAVETQEPVSSYRNLWTRIKDPPSWQQAKFHKTTQKITVFNIIIVILSDRRWGNKRF